MGLPGFGITQSRRRRVSFTPAPDSLAPALAQARVTSEPTALVTSLVYIYFLLAVLSSGTKVVNLVGVQVPTFSILISCAS